MARPKDQRERRAELVRAASRAIAARGVAGLTVRDVATQAGVSPGSVSYYYKSLDELVLAVHADAVQRFYAARRAALERVDDPVDQLAELVRLGVPESTDDLLCRVLYELHVHGARSLVHATLMSSLWEQEVSLYELVLTRGIERGRFTLRGPARRVAETVVAVEDAVGLHVVGQNPALTVSRARALLVDLVQREVGVERMPAAAAVGTEVSRR